MILPWIVKMMILAACWLVVGCSGIWLMSYCYWSGKLAAIEQAVRRLRSRVPSE
jgi:hypothetical protein